MKLFKGKKGEELALNYLKNNGYELIEKNFKSKFGEIDLVMKDGEVVVFVEVKYRLSEDYGSPKDAVTYGKIKKIIKTAEYFIVKNNLNSLYRFDVVSIFKDNIEHIKNAFTL
ncbi:YraN family protein [Deferribacteraceae bacterium V6Fe1]|nr:YraN family protein [Deferribacteraceae bacterium V6Fe1]